LSEKDNKKDKKKKESDLSDLLSLKIFGVEIGDLLKDIDGVREKLLAQQGELQKKFGDKVHVDIGIKVSGLDERSISYSGDRSLADLAKERTEWKKRIPTVTITKEDVKKAKEELEKKKQEEKDSGSS
jgi:tetrahydromethanopterin S-methyltransferase subunit G